MFIQDIYQASYLRYSLPDFRSKQKVQGKVGLLGGTDGNIITPGSLTAENLKFNDYFSSAFTREDIRSLPVPEPKFKVRESIILFRKINCNPRNGR